VSPWLVAALLASTAGRAAARAPEENAAAAGGGASASGPVALQVQATGLALDERSVREAILRELELDAATPSDEPPVSIDLRVVSGGDLTVTIQTGEGQGVSRSVATPARADEVPEVTALLVGNLARDEASGLLARLHRPEPEEPSGVASPAPEPRPEPEPVLPLSSVNLSLVYPLTLRENTEERRFALELGLFYGRIGALSGVALSAGGVTHVIGSVDGVMIGGIGYWHGGPAEGVRVGGVLGVGGTGLAGISLAGMTSIERGDVAGGQIAGVVNYAEGALDGTQIGGAVNVSGALGGAQIGGIFNLARGDMDGVQLSGASNVSGPVEGAQVSGIFNLARGDVDGFQLSGASNVSGPVEGAQVSGIFNLARGDVDGFQLSGAANLADRINGLQLSVVNIGGDVNGTQIGVVNVARDVDGLQLGLVNVAREVDGVSLGLVPYSSRGSTQAVAWLGSSVPFNFGVRFDTGVVYAMPTFGFDPRGNAEVFGGVDGDYAPGFSLGHRLHIGRAFADLDANYTNRSDGADYDEHDIELRYRLLGGLQLSRVFGVFAGGGVRHHFRTQGPSDAYVKPEFSLGVQLL
jgi:hypothetical protein